MPLKPAEEKLSQRFYVNLSQRFDVPVINLEGLDRTCTHIIVKYRMTYRTSKKEKHVLESVRFDVPFTRKTRVYGYEVSEEDYSNIKRVYMGQRKLSNHGIIDIFKGLPVYVKRLIPELEINKK